MNQTRTRPGEALAFLVTALEQDTDDCILWPYFVVPCKGYGQSKLVEEDIPFIRLLRYGGLLHREIAEVFGVSKTTITNTLNRKVWAHT